MFFNLCGLMGCYLILRRTSAFGSSRLLYHKTNNLKGSAKSPWIPSKSPFRPLFSERSANKMNLGGAESLGGDGDRDREDVPALLMRLKVFQLHCHISSHMLMWLLVVKTYIISPRHPGHSLRPAASQSLNLKFEALRLKPATSKQALNSPHHTLWVPDPQSQLRRPRHKYGLGL
jgi:hypothetical protein